MISLLITRDWAKLAASGVLNVAGYQGVFPIGGSNSCARLCHASGGELEQIQFLLGHVSIQTTERYLAASSEFGQL